MNSFIAVNTFSSDYGLAILLKSSVEFDTEEHQGTIERIVDNLTSITGCAKADYCDPDDYDDPMQFMKDFAKVLCKKIHDKLSISFTYEITKPIIMVNSDYYDHSWDGYDGRSDMGQL